MSKRSNKQAQTSSQTGANRQQMRKNAKRTASIEFYERQDGHVDIDFYDNQVRTTGRINTFDTLAHLGQQNVYAVVESVMDTVNKGLQVEQHYAPRDDSQELALVACKLEQVRQYIVNIRSVGENQDRAGKIARELSKIINQ